MFATLNFLPHTRFTPMQNISTEPMSDRYATAVAVITGERSRASSVMTPSKAKTGSAEKAAPLPMEDVITAMMMKSSTDFTASVEKSPSRPSCIEPIIAMAPMETVSDGRHKGVDEARVTGVARPPLEPFAEALKAVFDAEERPDDRPEGEAQHDQHRPSAGEQRAVDLEHPLHRPGDGDENNADAAGLVKRLLLLRPEELPGKVAYYPAGNYSGAVYYRSKSYQYLFLNLDCRGRGILHGTKRKPATHTNCRFLWWTIQDSNL